MSNFISIILTLVLLYKYKIIKNGKVSRDGSIKVVRGALVVE